MESDVSGEVVTFLTRSCGSITLPAIRSALQVAGFDTELARDMLPKNAFKRALRDLGERRVVREVEQHGSTIRFQVTKEWLDEQDDEWKYDTEDVFSLDTETGSISSEKSTHGVDHVQQLYDEALDKRTRRDVTVIIGRLFKNRADMLCLNPENGGTYLVPFDNTDRKDFADHVDLFIAALGGKMRRLPVKTGTERGDGAVRDLVREGLSELVEELTECTKTRWNSTTREGTINKHLSQFQAIRLKAEAHVQFLGTEMESLTAEIAKAEEEARARAAEVLSLSDND